MRRLILAEKRDIPPFNEPARELRVMNKPLWLTHRDVLAPYCDQELNLVSLERMPDDRMETIVYRDNLFFDQEFIDAFIAKARQQGKACRVAFALDDQAIVHHAIQFQRGIHREGDVYVADLWYFPFGKDPNIRPLVIDTEAREIGYYRVPSYMASESGDLTYQVPLKAFMAIEHWVHLYIANSIFGLFARGARFEQIAGKRLDAKLHSLWRAMLERKQVLRSSAAVKIGKNTYVDPAAAILGPATIGANCNIGAGAVIDNSIIGDNVTVGQDCQILLSVVCDRCFLPFRSALFMTTLMENSIVAQNTCLQMCVIGRNSFVGAGTTFTDFNLLPAPLRALNSDDELEDTGQPVLGSCVGHNARLGSGLIVMPARVIESDVVLFASPERRVINRNVMYEESDHHKVRASVAKQHRRRYPRDVDAGDAIQMDKLYRDEW